MSPWHLITSERARYRSTLGRMRVSAGALVWPVVGWLLLTDRFALASPQEAPALLAPLPAPISVVRKRDLRAVRIGSVVLAVGYVPAVALAAVLGSHAGEPNAPSALTNYALVVPIVGPLVSGLAAPLGNESGHAGALVTSWTLPIVLTLGLMQIGGGALLLHGAMVKDRQISADGQVQSSVRFPPWRTD